MGLKCVPVSITFQIWQTTGTVNPRVLRWSRVNCPINIIRVSCGYQVNVSDTDCKATNISDTNRQMYVHSTGVLQLLVSIISQSCKDQKFTLHKRPGLLPFHFSTFGCVSSSACDSLNYSF